jgi:hypothetical protein
MAISSTSRAPPATARTAALKDLVRVRRRRRRRQDTTFSGDDRARRAHLLRSRTTSIGKLREARRALTDAQPLLAATDACRAEATLPARRGWWRSQRHRSGVDQAGRARP